MASFEVTTASVWRQCIRVIQCTLAPNATCGGLKTRHLNWSIAKHVDFSQSPAGLKLVHRVKERLSHLVLDRYHIWLINPEADSLFTGIRYIFGYELTLSILYPCTEQYIFLWGISVVKQSDRADSPAVNQLNQPGMDFVLMALNGLLCSHWNAVRRTSENFSKKISLHSRFHNFLSFFTRTITFPDDSSVTSSTPFIVDRNKYVSFMTGLK